MYVKCGISLKMRKFCEVAKNSLENYPLKKLGFLIGCSLVHMPDNFARPFSFLNLLNT